MAKAPTEIKSLARSHTTTALNVLAGIMKETTAPHSARVAAATALLDRGWGKPAQTISGDPENPLKVIERIERVIVGAQTEEDRPEDRPTSH